MEEDGLHQTHESEVEIFCNQVAGAALIPMRQLLAEDIVSGRQKKPEWDDTELDKLASRYKASREVVLRRSKIGDILYSFCQALFFCCQLNLSFLFW
jgi:Zn-dependent peptidase ImmA (M78 family)